MVVRYTKNAVSDIRAAFSYIAHDVNRDIAGSVLTHVQNAIQSLSSFPEQGRTGRVEGTRELIIPKTPFVVVYRVAKDEIQILALLHGARRWPEEF